MGNATKIGLVGFLVILILIVYVYQVQKKEKAERTSAATATGTSGSGASTGTSTATDWVPPPVYTGTSATGTSASTGTGTSASTGTGETPPPETGVSTGTGTSAPIETGTGTGTGTATTTATGTGHAEQPVEYVIRKDDKLWTIAKKFYGDGRYYPLIAEANAERIPNPSNLPIGVKIIIPPLKKPGVAPPSEYEIYVVKKGDTLNDIARSYYGDAEMWKKIFQLNSDVISDPDRLKIGMKLRMPPRE